MNLTRLRNRLVLAAVILALPGVCVAADFTAQLREADRLAWLTDWYTALPIYSDVEKAATAAGSQRDALYAKFGRLRGQMQTLPLPDLSEEIATDLETPVATGDRRLRLRGLTVKGEIDLEWDVQAAQRDWEAVRELARELAEPGWENRANGELGIIAFLKGNTGEAQGLVQQALTVATKTGDVGGQLRYMGTIANGLLLAGYPTQATGYVDRALKFSAEHPEAGFPFVVYSTKVLTLLELDQADEAERFAKTAMAEARAGDRRIKEIELSMLLARIANTRGRPDEAIQHLEQAVVKAASGQVRRLQADAESVLADAYRSRGNLTAARRHAAAAVAQTQAAGSRFTLPVHLRILAETLAAQGNVVEANRVYHQAADIVDGIMINVPSREAQARLIGVRSNLYEGHFRLVAAIGDPAKAYDVLERARGRAAADVLSAPVGGHARPSAEAVAQARAISLLQTRLLRAPQPGERKQILDQLWEAEQRSTGSGAESGRVTAGRTAISIQRVQQQLSPDEVMLEYVLTEPRSYCLVISRRGTKLVPLQARSLIERQVEQFASAVKGASGSSPQAAKALFDVLLQPIAESRTAKRLFVVPDGRLSLVPFDALLGLNGAASTIVSTVPSANVFYLLRTRPGRVNADGPLLAIGGVPYERMFDRKATAGAAPPNQNRGLFDASYPLNLPALGSARAEVLSAARALGPDSVVLIGDAATETALKSQDLGRFGILHFATHAFADPKFPERAAIVLLNDPAAGQDGLLQPREIAQFRLQAGVVVLSACETAVGPTLGQEGVLNIARGFLLAGAQSVVMTLWPVTDATSSALMRRFYENLAAGQDVAQALTGSKNAVVEQFGVAALRSVSAFQLVGVGDYRVSTSRAGAYE